VQIGSLRDVKRALIMKHGTLTKAANAMGVSFTRLSACIGGRECIVYVVVAIQRDLGLSDDRVLELWPLLRSWPREVA
jgi:hypothetical protein